jgi:hydroxypyruvate reductase
MAAQLASHLGPLAGGIIAAPSNDDVPQLPGFRYFYVGSPLPNAESIRAAGAILKTLAALGARSLVIYLVSQGSSFVESPAEKEIPLEDLVAAYIALGESTASPYEAKAILKHISAVKGGRMALVAANSGAQQVSILMPNSKHQPPDSLAGGPTMPDASTVEDCYRIAYRYQLTAKFPASVRELFDRRALDETPGKDHPAFHNCRWWPIS